jgi:holo-[acyl-carrier protein] synthase
VILGTGIDLLEIPRLARSLERYGEHFVRKIFTEGEAAYCEARARRVEHYAARFAAKEAVMKALGTGVARGVGFRTVEVVREAGRAPEVRLHRAAKARAGELGVTRIHLSLTHTDRTAAAWVVLEGEGA